ncbi:MAG: hypothetical protein K0A98_13330 [Trueperaceae bacterium]|nr:hypothetical protein [Trueperaceae bacterium]
MGHAPRGYALTLGVGLSNLIRESGDGARPDDGVVVTDLVGVHAGANPITGDVSLQDLGLRGEGDAVRPVENFALSFDLFGLLERVNAVGDSLEWRPGGAGGKVVAPPLRADALSFAGA